ncbi:MAG: RNA polymerase sigma factor [Limisphaerales bacterium]
MSITVGVSEEGIDFDVVVDRHYQDVYRFALSLAGQPSDAADLTQETFLRFARNQSAIRKGAKVVKGWLMTTVFREFNQRRRHRVRFQHSSLEDSETELPTVDPGMIEAIDGRTVIAMVADLDEAFRASLALFYLEDFSYQEIAEVLDVPIGTVMSRLARGKAQMKRKLAESAKAPVGPKIRLGGVPRVAP